MGRRQIAVFVHPTETEFADAVETAALVAEYAVRSGARLLLAATPSAALDVCLSLLGDSVGRTVEGGERPGSPVVLVPLIRDGGPVDDAIMRDGTAEDDDEESGSFRDLIDIGLIAREDEDGFDPFADGDPVSAFVGALTSEPAPIVVGLGSNPRFWAPTLERLSNIPGSRLLRRPDITPFDYDERYRPVLRAVYIRDDDLLPADDDYGQDVVRARVQARLIAGILDELAGHEGSERHPE
ncbi:MAG: hypothetical protein WCF81_12250 [Roseiarcus sp.]